MGKSYLQSQYFLLDKTHTPFFRLIFILSTILFDIFRPNSFESILNFDGIIVEYAGSIVLYSRIFASLSNFVFQLLIVL